MCFMENFKEEEELGLGSLVILKSPQCFSYSQILIVQKVHSNFSVISYGKLKRTFWPTQSQSVSSVLGCGTRQQRPEPYL